MSIKCLSVMVVTLGVFRAVAGVPAVEMWRMHEISFESQHEYSTSGADAVALDVHFRHEKTGIELTRPAFWDGGCAFRVRFAPTRTGTWIWRSACDSDKSLDGKTGSLAATSYNGDLEIYRRGFLRVRPGDKYFTYADGTPFFYLGDTHWGMLTEEFDSAGPNAAGVQTDSHFKYVVHRRVEQGFTVYQSQPNGAKFDLTDGRVDRSDIDGFRTLDLYFREIADAGLVHANAQFFFPTQLSKRLGRDLDALERLSRYWVARYGAYPVMWTLAQEIDNDFLSERHAYYPFAWNDNPWVDVARFIHKYDCYSHPLTGHQESVRRTTIHGGGAKLDEARGRRDGCRSSFESETLRAQVGHNWWALQMGVCPIANPDWETVREYFADAQPSVLYEGAYCGLWTMDWGARAQGWIAFLNGMCGYGYGAADLWFYKSEFEMKGDSYDGFEKITLNAKRTPWGKSIEFPSSAQMGHLKKFMKELPWWKLTPDLGHGRIFEPEGAISIQRQGICACSAASVGNDLYVLYFNSTNVLTGWLKGCEPKRDYRLVWFNPRSGERSRRQMLPQADLTGRIRLPSKPDALDWVAEIRKSDGMVLNAENPVEIMDFGPESVGGYPIFLVKEFKRGKDGALPRLRISYSTHPDGLGDKGDFWRETSARYLGEDVDLPILPGNINRYDVFEVCAQGTQRARLLQGQVRYVRLKLENAAEGASLTICGFDFQNNRVHSEGELDGSFACSDPLLTKVWNMSVRTCELSAIPSYEATNVNPPVKTLPYLADGGKRDRLVWSGDLWWAERNMFYGFRRENPYMKGSIELLARNQTPDGYVQACPWPEQRPPRNGEYGPFPSDEFAAWFVPVVWDYVLYTDDAGVASNVWPNVEKLVVYLGRHVREDGIFEQRLETSKHAAGLVFGKSSCHHRAYMNVLLWKTYVDAAQLAQYLQRDASAKMLRGKAAELARSIRKRFWNGQKGGLIESIEDPNFGFEANALALAVKFATSEEARLMMPKLQRHWHGKFQALAARGKFEYGEPSEALKLFAAHNWFKVHDAGWKGARTTYECVNLTTKGWGDESHPDTAIAGILSSYVLGVEPVTPGFRTFRFRPPNCYQVWYAEGRVPTPYGYIEARWDRDREGNFTHSIRCPPGTAVVE